MKEVILVFGAEPILPILQMTFAPQKMALRSIKNEELSETIGALAGLTGYAKKNEVYAGPALEEPMLVFCGFTSERMNLALAAMRKNSVKIPCKAMLTEYNRDWLPLQLLKELQEEHAAMTKGNRSH